MTAAVAEVEVNRTNGKVTVKRVTLAQDCGLIVNPDGTKNQIEGNVDPGRQPHAARRGEVRRLGHQEPRLGRLTRSCAFRMFPQIDIVLVNRPDMPALGGGEPSLVPVPAAIANAIFDATGARLREVPMTPERVLSGDQIRHDDIATRAGRIGTSRSLRRLDSTATAANRPLISLRLVESGAEGWVSG